MVTSIVRAVLNVMVQEADTLGWTVLSATTDGMMVLMPDLPLAAPVYKGTPYVAPPRALMHACERHQCLQLLLQGRQNIGEDPANWLEVKYVGSEAYTFKTRTNWIGWHGETVNQALVGFKKEDVTIDQLREIREQQSHQYYTQRSLHTIEDIIEGKAADITSYYHSVEVNLAPDWKRIFFDDGHSQPFQSLAAWRDCRKIVDRLKWQAFPNRVAMVLQGKRATLEKSARTPTQAAIIRAVLERIVLGSLGFRLPQGMSHRAACQKLGIPHNTLTKLKSTRITRTPLPLNDTSSCQAIIRIRELLNLW
jgi:hypothetical protein